MFENIEDGKLETQDQLLTMGKETILVLLDREHGQNVDELLDRVWRHRDRNEMLWHLVELLRGTRHWGALLKGILEIPEHCWSRRGFNRYNVKGAFSSRDIEDLCRIYGSSDFDGDLSPIVAELNFDRYWTERVQDLIQKKCFRKAWYEINQARFVGLGEFCGIAKASKGCLEQLCAKLLVEVAGPKAAHCSHDHFADLDAFFKGERQQATP